MREICWLKLVQKIIHLYRLNFIPPPQYENNHKIIRSRVHTHIIQRYRSKSSLGIYRLCAMCTKFWYNTVINTCSTFTFHIYRCFNCNLYVLHTLHYTVVHCMYNSYNRFNNKKRLWSRIMYNDSNCDRQRRAHTFVTDRATVLFDRRTTHLTRSLSALPAPLPPKKFLWFSDQFQMVKFNSMFEKNNCSLREQMIINSMSLKNLHVRLPFHSLHCRRPFTAQKYIAISLALSWHHMLISKRSRFFYVYLVN